MRVIPPLTITDAMLTTPAVAEPDAAVGEVAWSNTTTYALAAKVISTATHRTYKSVQAGNVGHDPTTDDGTWWLDDGPTNRWAMFDLLRNTGTVKASTLSATITPGQRIDAIGIVGIVADSVTVTVNVGGSPVYTRTVNLRVRNTLGWYDYFFRPFEQKTAVAFFDLPPYVNAVITVALTRSSGNCTCGGVIIGQSVYIGKTIHGAENDALNFSLFERDPFGTLSKLIPRRTVPKGAGQTRLEKIAVNRALKLRIELNAVPALWSGLDDAASGYFEPLLILGVYKRFTITMDQPDRALVSFELEEI